MKYNSNKRIRILEIYTNSNIGGVQQHILSLLKEYNREIVSPLFCCFGKKGEIGVEIEKLGIDCIFLDRPKYKRFSLSIIIDLYNLMKKKEINVVKTHNYYANLYGRLSALMAGVPVKIASVQIDYHRKDKSIIRRIVNNLLSKITDKVVAISESVKMDILKYDHVPEDKVTVIYNGIDGDRFSGIEKNLIRSELGISPETLVIGTVGRLVFQKGHQYLLEAISKLKGRIPRLMLLIVGDGRLKDELKDYAKALNISQDVLFLGNRRDIPEILSAIDIFVFPSLWEGLGMALIEAMAAGKPIIATDIPPIREIVNSEKVGILVPPKNSNAIADSIEFLFHNKNFAENLSNAARERVFTTFHIKTTARQYTELFENILRSKIWNI
ncbi:MAG: glycosyltransferase [Thermodesulfovibrionales bacterium]